MPTKERADDLKDRRAELICAEECTHHRPVSEIRAEIAVLLEVRRSSHIPKPRQP
jgi:hypothetical protein